MEKCMQRGVSPQRSVQMGTWMLLDPGDTEVTQLRSKAQGLSLDWVIQGTISHCSRVWGWRWARISSWT